MRNIHFRCLGKADRKFESPTKLVYYAYSPNFLNLRKILKSMGRSRSQTPQVYHNLEITDLASEGMGIARHEGMVVFVEQAVTGDVVDVQITRKKSGFRQGKVIHFHQRSALRVEPKCEHFGICGGCKWQVISYADQLKHKAKQVKDALTRIAKVPLPEIAPIHGSATEYYYRNKLEYTFSASRWLTEEEIGSKDEFSDRAALGFHIPGRFDKVLKINNCYLQPDPSNAMRLFVEKRAKELGISFFNLMEQTGVMRNLLLRNNSKGEWMVCLSVTDALPEVFTLLDDLKAAFPQIHALLYTINTKRNDTISDLDIFVHSGAGFIEEEMEGLRFRIGPKSFYQTNSEQAYELYKHTRAFAGITKDDVVYDLYTGTGTIALFVAGLAKKVVGVEYVPEAVADAKINAEVNGVENVSFFAGDMKDVLVEGFFETHGKPDVIITDPPRAGMHDDVTKRLIESGARRIVYVSCNPATQARDLILLDQAYTVVAVQPVDMFPQTTHVENIVVLDRKN